MIHELSCCQGLRYQHSARVRVADAFSTIPSGRDRTVVATARCAPPRAHPNTAHPRHALSTPLEPEWSRRLLRCVDTAGSWWRVPGTKGAPRLVIGAVPGKFDKMLRALVGFEPTPQKKHGLSTTPFVKVVSGVLVRLTTCKRST